LNPYSDEPLVNLSEGQKMLAVVRLKERTLALRGNISRAKDDTLCIIFKRTGTTPNYAKLLLNHYRASATLSQRSQKKDLGLALSKAATSTAWHPATVSNSEQVSTQLELVPMQEGSHDNCLWY
jgi:hypothetical protein